jgi:hypothetical protein
LGWPSPCLTKQTKSVPEAHSLHPTYRQYRVLTHERPQKWRHPEGARVNVNQLQWKPCTYPTNITRGRQPQSTNQASTHVRKYITIQVGHDHDTVTVRSWILRYLSSGKVSERTNRTRHALYLQADPIKKIFVISDIREFLRDFAARGQEHAIRHFPGEIDISHQ